MVGKMHWSWGRRLEAAHVEWFEQRKDAFYEEIRGTIHFENFDEFIQHFIDEIKTPLPYGFSAKAAAYVVVHLVAY